jgi:hypothetical protein
LPPFLGRSCPEGVSVLANLLKSYQQRTGMPKEMVEK